MMLYICTKFCEIISKGFRITDLNSRVKARVVANVDERMDACTDERMDNQILYCAMPEAGATKIQKEMYTSKPTETNIN